MFPAEPRIAKDVHADTVLPGTYFTPGSKDTPSVETGKLSMAVPAGSTVIIDIWGMHMNRESSAPRTKPRPANRHPASQLCIGEKTLQSSNLNTSSTPSLTSGREMHVSTTVPRPMCLLDSRLCASVLPFSIGARSCIGQRFAYAEMVGILASVVRRYRIVVPDDLAKKSLEEQKEALLKWTTGLTMTPLSARVKLCRRV